MASINTKEQLRTAHTEIKDVIRDIKSKIANVSNVNHPSIDVEGERRLIEQTINDIANASANQVAGLKTRLNARVSINRLPIEILTYIILLTNTCTGEGSDPYTRYTWVCHRWRSALIQNSAFWTVIQHRSYRPGCHFVEPLYEEFLSRTKSAKLDIRLTTSSDSFISTLKKLFAQETDRICSLQVNNQEDLLQLVLSGKQFPSLQRLALFERSYNSRPEQSLIRLAPVLVASDHLETLHCTLWGNTPFDHLAPLFSRIRNFKLISSHSALQPLFNLLHNHVKLQTLQLSLTNFHYAEHDIGAGTFNEVVFPELLFLSVNSFAILKLFRAPKLSSLDAAWTNGCVAIAFKNTDFPPIRYLRIQDSQSRKCNSQAGLCLLGSKDPGRICCESLFSETSKVFYENSIPQVYPRDCFHLSYGYMRTFNTVLPEMSLILPRLTSLVEVHFLITHALDEFERLIIHLPSIEGLVVKRGNKLLDVIRLLTKSPPLCSRLKHLYFKTFLLPKNLEKYANDIGKALTKCLKSRRKDSAEELEHLDLKNCPPLPDNWLKTLEELGTVVVTESSVKNVIVRSRKEEALHEHSAISDVESD